MSRHKDPIHGYIYQLKLLMLFLHRGIRLKYDFKLRTEMVDARCFDDLLFEYKQDNKTFFRLLQAKHSLDERKKITAGNLLDLSPENKDYNLIKYYNSYIECRHNKLFEGGLFKDLIICTNIGFDFQDLEEREIQVHEITEDDEILKIIRNGGKEPKLYTFDESVAGLLKSQLETHRDSVIAENLVNFILGNKPLHKKKFDYYVDAIFSEVIDKKNKLLYENFVKNEDLSERASEFREIFEYEIRKQSDNKLDLDKLHTTIKDKSVFDGKTIELNIPQSVGKMSYRNKMPWPSNNIDINDVLSFIKLLKFAVNQPNEDELGKAIIKEIGSQFNKLTSETIYKDLFRHMVDFLQGKKDTVRNKIEFWSYKDGETFINDTCFEILHLQMSSYRNYLDSINFKFKQNIFQDCQNFIDSNITLWLLTSQAPWLSTLAIYQTIKNREQVKNLFIYKWSDLLDNNGEILLDFRGLNDFLIIISCLQMIGSEDITDEIVRKIKQLFIERRLIKIIVVSSEKHEFKRTLEQQIDSIYSNKLNIRFSDLDDEHQILLLERENILFEGSHRLSIKKLLDIKDREFKQQSKILNLDASDIEFLLRSSKSNSEIKIFNQINDFLIPNSLTYKPNKLLNFDCIIKEIGRNKSDIFAFVGNEKKIKMMFQKQGIDLTRFDERDAIDKVIKHRLFLLELETEENEFNLLCKLIYKYTCETSAHFKPILHKLKYIEDNKWIWTQTFNVNFYITRYYQPNILGVRTLKGWLANETFPDFLILTGMIKSKYLNEFFRDCFDFNRYVFENNCVITKSRQAAKRKFNFLNKTVIETQPYEPNDNYLTVTRFYNKKTIHLIKLQKVKPNFDYTQKLVFLWQQSAGNVNRILKGLSFISDFLHEDIIIDQNERFMLFCDGPGAGKSSTLTRIIENLKKYNSTSLVIEIDLNKLQRFSNSFCVKSKNELSELLLFEVPKKSNTYGIEKKIIQYKLEYSGQLFLLFDGFDEVDTERLEIVHNLFNFIMQETKANVWITTRNQNEQKLQESFCALNYSLQELGSYDKFYYLANFLDTSLTFSEKDITLDYFNKFMVAVKDHFFRTFSYFCKTPLMLRFVAKKYDEVLNDSEMDDSVIEKKIEKIKLADVIKSVIYHVYEIYFVEKIKIFEGFESELKGIIRDIYSNAYKNLAAEIVGVKLCQFKGMKMTLSETTIEKVSLTTLSKIGLIKICDHHMTSLPIMISERENSAQVNDCNRDNIAVEFIHPLFKEFFVTEYVCFKLKSYQSSEILWEYLIDTILCNEFSLEIFNNMLNKDEKLSKLSSRRSQKKIIFRLLLRQKNKMNNARALWKAVEYSFKNTVIFLLKSFFVRDHFIEAITEILNLPENSFVSRNAQLSDLLNYVMGDLSELLATGVDLRLINMENVCPRNV